MKTRSIIKLSLVAAAGIYLVYRSRNQLEKMADDWTTLFGTLLIVALLALAIRQVLRS